MKTPRIAIAASLVIAFAACASSRTAAGAPGEVAPSDTATTTRPSPSLQRDTTMIRDTTAIHDTTMVHDTSMMRRDTTSMPRDTTMQRDTSTYQRPLPPDTSARRDSTGRDTTGTR